MSLKERLILNSKNIPGRNIDRKIIIIECDDYGGIRMPSLEVLETLKQKEIDFNPSRYNRFDTLEREDDLELLFEILEEARDTNGKSAVMTPVMNVANPDFEKIRETGFEKYAYEEFTDTYKKYGISDRILDLWEEGRNKGIFIPELHGREHINVQTWLKKLKSGHQHLLGAFDHGFVFIAVDGLPGPAQEFRPAFFFDQPEHIPFLESSIDDSISIFRKHFRRLPSLFVPTNNLFHPCFEKAVKEAGVNSLYASYRMLVPDGKGGIRNKLFWPGKSSKFGLHYHFRNCAFEPTDEAYRGTGLTLRQIDAAFRWKKPAIISSHRVNFVGGIDPKNRSQGLTELRKLLTEIRKNWPDAEFMSSKEYLDLISKNSE